MEHVPVEKSMREKNASLSEDKFDGFLFSKSYRTTQNLVIFYFYWFI